MYKVNNVYIEDLHRYQGEVRFDSNMFSAVIMRFWSLNAMVLDADHCIAYLQFELGQVVRRLYH